MDLRSLCQRPIVTIEAERTLQQAALLMREQHVGALVVVEPRAEGLHASGIVTDRDLAIEVLARGGDAAKVPVGRLASGHVVSVGAGADLLDAIGLMQSAGVRRLLVRDDEGHLVGVVSFDDLLQAAAALVGGLAAVLRKGAEREAAERGALAAATAPRVRVPAMGTAGWTMRL